MSINWNDLAEDARRMIEEDGMAMQIKVPSTISTAFDITTGKNTVTYTTYNVVGFITKFSSEIHPGIDLEDVRIITHAGKVSAAIPDLSDKDNLTIVAGGKNYVVKRVNPIRPAGVVLIYEFQAKESSNA